MKLVKSFLFSAVIWMTLSSFGLVNNSNLLSAKKIAIVSDSLNQTQGTNLVIPSQTIKEVPQENINQQKEEEKAKTISFANKVGYFILLGLKTVITFFLKILTI